MCSASDLWPSRFAIWAEWCRTSPPICLRRVPAVAARLLTPAVGQPVLPFASTLPLVGTVQLLETNGVSNYNALQVIFQRRYKAGLTFQSNYTYSSALSDVGGTGWRLHWLRPGAERLWARLRPERLHGEEPLQPLGQL